MRSGSATGGIWQVGRCAGRHEPGRGRRAGAAGCLQRQGAVAAVDVTR